MQKYTAKEARKNFSEVIAKAAFGNQRVVVTKNGRDSVAIVPISDLELLAEIERVVDLNVAEAAIAQAEAEGTVSLEKLKEDLGE